MSPRVRPGRGGERQGAPSGPGAFLDRQVSGRGRHRQGQAPLSEGPNKASCSSDAQVTNGFQAGSDDLSPPPVTSTHSSDAGLRRCNASVLTATTGGGERGGPVKRVFKRHHCSRPDRLVIARSLCPTPKKKAASVPALVVAERKQATSSRPVAGHGSVGCWIRSAKAVRRAVEVVPPPRSGRPRCAGQENIERERSGRVHANEGCQRSPPVSLRLDARHRGQRRAEQTQRRSARSQRRRRRTPLWRPRGHCGSAEADTSAHSSPQQLFRWLRRQHYAGADRQDGAHANSGVRPPEHLHDRCRSTRDTNIRPSPSSRDGHHLVKMIQGNLRKFFDL